MRFFIFFLVTTVCSLDMPALNLTLHCLRCLTYVWQSRNICPMTHQCTVSIYREKGSIFIGREHKFSSLGLPVEGAGIKLMVLSHKYLRCSESLSTLLWQWAESWSYSAWRTEDSRESSQHPPVPKGGFTGKLERDFSKDKQW